MITEQRSHQSEYAAWHSVHKHEPLAAERHIQPGNISISFAGFADNDGGGGGLTARWRRRPHPGGGRGGGALGASNKSSYRVRRPRCAPTHAHAPPVCDDVDAFMR